MKELECKYYEEACFTNLYPILNSVVVHGQGVIPADKEHKKDQQPKEKRWNLKKSFKGIVEGRESEIRQNLRSCKDATEATEKFRELYLDPIFNHTPKDKAGKYFKALTKRIISEGLYKAGDK